MGWLTTPYVKVAVARRRDGSDGVALGTVATARNGYLPRLLTERGDLRQFPNAYRCNPSQ